MYIETKAPEGYVPGNEKFHVEITLDGFFINGKMVETDEYHLYFIEFTNKKVTPPNNGVDLNTTACAAAAGISHSINQCCGFPCLLPTSEIWRISQKYIISEIIL